MPNRRNVPAFSSYLYRYRNLVERFFNKIKHYRAVATRYDKRADNFLAGVKLASIRVWLRFNEFDDLDQCGALTPDYSELLDGVPSELASADAARAAGKSLDARAAMMRAVGKVNLVIAAFVGPRPEM